MRKDWKASDRF
jgi:hypothetical protein